MKSNKITTKWVKKVTAIEEKNFVARIRIPFLLDPDQQEARS
jgi:hypothetical protein